MTPASRLNRLLSLETSETPSLIAALYEVWLRLHLEMAAASTDADRDKITGLEDTIFESARKLSSASLSDIACKLALWRWDCAELDSGQPLQRADAIALSAFEDFCKALGDAAPRPPCNRALSQSPSIR